jgi:hypothetical protein
VLLKLGHACAPVDADVLARNAAVDTDLSAGRDEQRADVGRQVAEVVAEVLVAAGAVDERAAVRRSASASSTTIV